jgi:hypothetical protein
MSEINNYIPVSRKIFEHRFWCEDRVYSRFEAWLDIVQSARFEDTEHLIGNRLITVKRGQFPVSLRYLAERWKWSTKKVNAYLESLIQAQMVTKETPKETGQTILTVCNYDTYNFKTEKGKRQKKREGNSKETPRKQEGNEYNKDNNENNLKKSIFSSENILKENSLEKIDFENNDPNIDVSALRLFDNNLIFNFEDKNQFCGCKTETGERCNQPSSYRINKKNYCCQHAKELQEDATLFRNFEDWLSQKAPYCYKNMDRLSIREFLALRSKYTSKQIADTITQLENRKDLRKRYTSLYRTLLNWIKNETERKK